ncbi:hypothetical protein [Nonomuraea dietziae]
MVERHLPALRGGRRRRRYHGLNGSSTQSTNGVPAAFTLNDTTCARVA